jgi:GntR family transcriptional repressor for pyruvate dehydrogenase complex
MEKAAALTDEAGFVKADLEFHLAVAKAGHNHLLEQFYHLVRELLSEVITEMVALPKVKDESIVLQRAIAQAIEANDTQRAEEAAQKHMQYIENLLRIYS